MSQLTGDFRYLPPVLTRLAERFFPQWAHDNRRAALNSHVFDQAALTKGFQANVRQFATAYDILQGDRTRKGLMRSLTGTGDTHLTEQALSDLRETARDASRNDPIVRGLLESYAEGIVGTELPIEARSSDEAWNKAREALWQERMEDQPCEITGRFTFTHSIFLSVLSFSRDGDFFVIWTPDGPWLCEGEQCGSPSGINVDGGTFTVTNGVAAAKPYGTVIGYYIGTPDRWGYIRPGGYTKYTADQVHHVFDPDRISYSRGEPLLTPSVQVFDKGLKYFDAELVTSCVQACQGVAIKSDAPQSLLPAPATHKPNSDVDVEDYLKRFQMAPGMVWDLDPGDEVQNIGATRPTSNFGEFMNKVLMIAGRAAGMPLMLITQDLSGATFMNARIAAQMAQERWKKVQRYVVKPLASRWYLWRTQGDIDSGELSPAPEDWRKHEVFCRRWPYVDPEKEAKAAGIDLSNGTTDLIYECASRGRDYRDVVRGRVKAKKIEEEEGLETAPADSENAANGQPKKETDDGSGGKDDASDQ